jgi:hypothetical protein
MASKFAEALTAYEAKEAEMFTLFPDHPRWGVGD